MVKTPTLEYYSGYTEKQLAKTTSKLAQVLKKSATERKLVVSTCGVQTDLLHGWCCVLLQRADFVIYKIGLNFTKLFLV